MLDTSITENLFSECFQCRRVTFEQDHFETVIVVDMNMGRGNNILEVFMLEIRQRLFQFSLMMIVNKNQCSENRALSGFDILLNEFITHDIRTASERFVYPLWAIR